MTAPLSGTALALLDALPEAALIVAPDGKIRYCNRVAADLLGYTPAEIVDEPVARIVVALPGQKLDVVAWFARWAADPTSPQLRYLTLTGRTRDGRELRLSVRVARVTSKSDEYLVTLRDVTVEQRAHHDTKHAHLVASRVLASSDDAIVNIDGRGRITLFNRKAEQLFGYTAGEVLGQPLDKLLPERFRMSHQAHVEAFEHGRAASRLMGERGEIVGLTRSGEEIPFEASIAKVFIEGEPTFSAQLRDIRPRKAAELARIESERRFRVVFEHALEAMALLTAEGRVLELNNAAQRLLGSGIASNGELFADLPWWSRLPGDSAREARLAMQDALARCRAGEEIRTRGELIDANGERRIIDFSLRPVVASGRTTCIVAEGRDITAHVES
jgi:PAS domain S-box-containing protein